MSHEATLDPDHITWTRVSPRYFQVRLIQRLMWTFILVAIVALPLIGTLLWNWGWPLWLCGTLVGFMAIWQITLCIIVGRQVKAMGYAEFPKHLLITRGILTRQVTAVPYGRMQLVDIKSGPLEGMLKLASVELQTASPATNAIIRGLTQQEADRLREVLTSRGEEQMVAL